MVHITCGNKTPKIPQNGCSDCEQLEERVEALEQCCEDVHTALDEKADETEITEIMHIINGLAAGWHYIDDIDGVENLPTSVSAGEAFYDTTTGSWYIAKDDIPSGATINDFLFVSGNDYTLHTDTVNGEAVLQLQDSHNHTSNIPVVGEGAVNVEDTGDELTISVENATPEQAGLMSPEDKDKLDNVYDLYDTACGDPAELENAESARLKSAVVTLEPHQDGTPWQDSTLYKTPFLFRKVPSVNHSINSRYTTLVGADVPLNQKIYADYTNMILAYCNKSMSGSELTLICNDNIVNIKGICNSLFIAGHVYYISGYAKSDGTAGVSIGFRRGGVSFSDGTTGMGWDTSTTYHFIQHTAKSTSPYDELYGAFMQNDTASGNGGTFKNVQVIDLTQMLGADIANAVHTKESALVGSGIAWLKANGFDFSKYITYNAGSLVAVNPSAIVTRGFNQWDGETESGYIYNGSYGVSSSYWRTKNFIKVLPNTEYCFSNCSGDWQINGFDAGQNFVGAITATTSGSNKIATIPENCRYIKFYQPVSISANTVCVNISKTTGTPKNGDYRAYSEHEYALGNFPLHGKYDLVDGNIVAYGDTRTSDGTRTHNYGVKVFDGTTGAWSEYDGAFYQYFTGYKKVASGKNAIGDALVFAGQNVGITGLISAGRGCFAFRSDTDAVQIYPTDSNITTSAQLNTYLTAHPLTVIYELATPTTDTADPFTSPQAVDADGTEEFVTSNDVPVGNQTRYADVYEITGTDEVTVTVADDPDNPTTSDDYTTALGEIVYEGTVDVVSGKLTVTMASIDSYNGETINEPWLSSLDPYVAGTTPTIGAQVVYTLDTPIEIDLTPTDIEALLGDNYVWSEQGSICVTFMVHKGDLTDALSNIVGCCDHHVCAFDIDLDVEAWEYPPVRGSADLSQTVYDDSGCITENSIIVVSPKEYSIYDYAYYELYCVAHGNGWLQFTARETPMYNIDVNVLVINIDGWEGDHK